MTVLAAHNGNAAEASKSLKSDHGMNVTPASLRTWRNSGMREEYERIVADLPDATSAVINETLETARLAAQAERLAIERTLNELQAGTCKDPARAARDLSHIKSLNVEKYLTLTGRPTQIVEVNPDQALAQLLRDGVFLPAAADEEATFELPAEAVRELLPGPIAEDPLTPVA